MNFVVNSWRKVGEKRTTLPIYLNFKQTFEKIDRDILIRNLYIFGIRDNELKWFGSYLRNSKQVKNLNNVRSNLIDNDVGVLQGSHCALLFIYI